MQEDEMNPNETDWNYSQHITIEKAANLVQIGEYKQAQKILSDIIGCTSKNCSAYGLLAISYGRQGNYDALLKYSKLAVQIRFNFPEAHNNIGIAFDKKSNYRQAVKSFKTAIRLKPNYSEAFFNLANTLRKQRKVKQAEQAYKNAIKNNPSHAKAYNHLGSLLKEKGSLDLAIENFQSALCIDKHNLDALLNLGNALRGKGQLDLAIHYFKLAIEVEPSQITAYLQLANIYYKKNDYQRAEQVCLASLTNIQANSCIYEILGNIYCDSGRPDSAIDAYKSALTLATSKDQGKYLLLIGDLYKNNNNPMEAVNCYERAITNHPNYAEAYAKLGKFLLDSSKHNTSIKLFKKAIKLKPDFPEAYNNMGNALMGNGDTKAAIAMFKKAISVRKNYPEAYVNLGIAYSAIDRVKSGIHAYQIAIQLNPNLALAHYNLGYQQSKNGKLNEAIVAYERAISIQPDLHDALYNLGRLKLLKGDYKKGLKLYESRFKCSVYYDNNSLLFKPDCERWLGEILPSGKRLLIICEQGLGDIIQFIRYVLYLKNTGISISVFAPAKLHPLIKESGIDSSPLLPTQYSSCRDQKWVPLLSIPLHLNITPKNPLIVDPYITTSYELTAKWRSDMKLDGKKLTIGVNWEGNRSDEAKTGRNFSVNYLKKISDIEGINLISLQRGTNAQGKIPTAIKKSLVSQQNRINEIINSDSGEDFLQYAAVIKNCDLIITTATTLAHLAGSMGIKTWVLLPNIPDWRWGTKSDSTFWYPSVKLFRQENDTSWFKTWGKLHCELKKFAEQHRGAH